LLMLFAERGQFYGVPAPGAMVSLEVQDEHDRRVWAYPMPDLSDEDEGAR
jgi:hypothetical protein